MLQRIQSVWLLLAAGFDAVTFRFPFFSGDWERDSEPAVIDLNAQTTLWLTILSVIIGLLAFIAIFFFSNRKVQLRLTILGILLSLGLIVLYFLEMTHFYSGTVAIWVIFYFAILACFILAARGIYRDQKLIRSMDRLR